MDEFSMAGSQASSLLALVGAVLFWYRLRACRMPASGKLETGLSTLPRSQPLVSIIVPARNEEHNLPKLLLSLKELRYSRVEIIVVDDGSSDATAQIALDAGVRLVRVRERPANFHGKSYACLQGANVALGEVLLFTDADVTMYKSTLDQALCFMEEADCPFISSLPYHLCEEWWEHPLAAFQLCMVAALHTRSVPNLKQPFFSIGQFLMMTRDCYQKIGTHMTSQQCIHEDLLLARTALERGLRFMTYSRTPLFKVRMYDTPMNFFRGWRRNLRTGFSFFSARVAVLITLFMIAGLSFLLPPYDFIKSMAGIIFGYSVLRYSQQHGDFRPLGAVFFPIALLVFSFISLFCLFDSLWRRPIVWKGRQYASNPTS